MGPHEPSDSFCSAVLLPCSSRLKFTSVLQQRANAGSATNTASINTRAGCTVGSGTYVKYGTTLDIHGLATVSGSCDLYGLDAHQQCSKWGTDVNAVDHLTLWKDGAVTGWTSSWQSWPHPQTFDTHSSGSTGPISDSTATVGTHTYFHHSVNNISPNCSPTAPAGVDSSPPIEVTVLKCEPKWLTDPNNNLRHLSPGTVSIYLDPSSFAAAASALDAAISAWNAQMTGTGVTFIRVSSPCGTGGNCISIVPTDLSSQNTPLCGFSPQTATDGSGAFVSSMELQVDSLYWTIWNAASFQRTFEHELGHRLGLDDYDPACDSTGNSAVMQNNFHCNATATPSTTVSMNDYIPVNKTVYSGQTRATCGY